MCLFSNFWRAGLALILSGVPDSLESMSMEDRVVSLEKVVIERWIGADTGGKGQQQSPAHIVATTLKHS